MKLIYRILLRLSLALLAVLTVWTVFFYFTMIDEINDEVDDALEDYSETIIIRSLAGKELPSKNDGSNNSYSIRPITREEARQYPAIEYYDADIYIKEKEETEPARVLRTIFADKDDNYFLLEVSTPSFEKEDLREAVANWILLSLYCFTGHPAYGLHLGVLSEPAPVVRATELAGQLFAGQTARTCSQRHPYSGIPQVERSSSPSRRTLGTTIQTAEAIYRQCIARTSDTTCRLQQPYRMAARQYGTDGGTNGRTVQDQAYTELHRPAE